MRRVGHLVEKIAQTDNLLLAFYKARRGKQHKYQIRLFGDNLAENILKLQQEILSTDVVVGKYHYFRIYDPKERQICAAPFRERVLHHAIINVCKPYFERNLIYDTYATREGKGVYAAIDKARKGMRHFQYVAKLDVRKYFDSISHAVLKDKLKHIFKDISLLTIFDKIIDSYSVELGYGIPIGNLTSQYFANFYLSSVDHYMKECVGVPVYVRYMDDILLFATTRDDIERYVTALFDVVQHSLQLRLKPPVVQHTRYGISFLGYMLFPQKILLNRRSKIRLRQKMLAYESHRKMGKWNEVEYMQHISPLLAFANKAYTRGLRSSICNECMAIKDC